MRTFLQLIHTIFIKKMYNKKVLYKKRQKVTNHRQSMEQRKRNKKGTKKNRHQIALEKSQALCYSTIELKKYLEEKG